MSFSENYSLTLLDPENRLEDALRLDAWAFPMEIPFDDLLRLQHAIPWGRFWGVEARDSSASSELSGMYGAHTLRAFPVPGAEVACGWLTWVAVHPAHRRRGLLRSMMMHHFNDCRERGEAVSGLAAAEAGIYGRFGYGAATPQMSLTVPRGAALRVVAGSEALTPEMHIWDPALHGDEIARLHRDVARLPEGIGRPGWVTWETPELRESCDEDAPVRRHGLEALRVLIVRDASGAARGYARFRRKPVWDRDNAEGVVILRDIVALDPAATHLLWSILLDLDLTSRVDASLLPIDDPILSLLVDARAAKPVTHDLHWLRLIDVPRALAERRYAAPLDVVVGVRDELIPENAGLWRVRVNTEGAAEVTPSDVDPDFTLDVRELGAAHLGTVSLAALAQAGLVEVHRPAALARAATAWSWPVAAGANWIL
ncbi:GNAT family N-acetyltransferase [Leucobacter insecticola]|uniref:GNAT family N-acetyltransferase n=1 Tax=Leucobacter insecticola TaxID=2714934 RepID=A0A6G8FG71_9MICO|nr:GNAT family N-acetyltransferase [Leucobacter insecticola]QIM15337.1 GNAT family N-acetyltransferase [Leucobacter insecticola]